MMICVMCILYCVKIFECLKKENGKGTWVGIYCKIFKNPFNTRALAINSKSQIGKLI